MALEEHGPGQMYLRAPGKEVYRGIAEGQSGHHHRDPLVPGAQGRPRERVGRRAGGLLAEEPDTCGVDGLDNSDRAEGWVIPLPRSLAHLMRVISEK